MTDLDVEYAGAVYRLDRGTPEAFVFDAPARAVLLAPPASLPSGRWALITAYNPGRCTLSPDANSLRHAQLLAFLHRRGRRWLPTHSHDRRGGHREHGCLVLDTTRDEALEAMRRFDQRAVVFGADGRCGLLFARTERWVVMPWRSLPIDPAW